MLNKEREQEIINILKTSSGFVSVKQLCDMLYASESSIRRDLKSLEKQGLVNRSYGGASFENNISNIATFNLRTQHKTNEKQMIARKALSLIHEGDIVFLDKNKNGRNTKAKKICGGVFLCKKWRCYSAESLVKTRFPS